MADGLFDDLIPQAKRPALGDAPAAAASGGLFDDLVPRANPFADVVGGIDTTEALGNVGAVTRVDPNEVIVPEGIAPEPPGLGESLYRRAQAGLSGLLGGTSRFLGETLAPVRPQSPLVAAAIDQVLPTRAGTALTDTGVSLGELSAATRAEAQSGERPASIMDALTNPGDTARYYGGIGAESLPAILVALATRNPGAATAVAGGTTAAQSYGDLRQQGVAIPQAIRGATEQGVLEAAGSQAPLERAFGGAPLGRRILQTTGDEVAGEVATQLGQDVAERTGRGEDVPVGELLLGALDAAIASAPGGVVEALGGRGPEPGAAPRETPTYRGVPVVAAQTLGGEPIARQEPQRAAPAAAPSPQVRTPAAEALDDLDALLEQLPRPAAPESPTASPSEPPTGAPPREAAATYNDQFRRPEPAVVEPVRSEGAPLDRERMAPTSDPLDLRREIGWSEIGGRMIREADTGGLKPEVVGRTQWVGQMAPDGSESSFWRNRPDRSLTERQANEAFDKFERGEPLRPIEQRFIDHARSTAEGYARAEQEIAEDLLAYDQAEQARAVQNLREAHDIDVSEADGADALSLYELVRRNAERGVPLEELDQPQAESDRAYAARLWSMLKEEPNVDANPARSDQGSGEARRAEPSVRAAAPSGSGLFAAPTAREVVDAEARRRDAERDGRTGTGRTDMAAGGGELFAGPRPQQAALEGVTRLPRVRNTDQRARTVVQEADGWHVQFDDQTVSPGAYATQADAIAARDEHNANRRRAASSDIGAELVADLADDARRGGNEDADRRGLRAEVNRVLGPVGERVEYVRGEDGLPDRVRRGIERRQSVRDENLRTAAVYDPVTRRVYLLTDVVTDPARAAFHAAHEIAGHDGLRALLGDKLDPALGIARQNPTVKAVADAIAAERNIPQTGERGILLATEEALAELAAAVRTGNYDEIQSRYKVAVPEGVRARLKEAISNFLKRLRAAIDDLFGNHQFTDEDVRALLENAWQAANDGATIESDAAPVESTAPDQTQTPEFKRWFGESKVVDRSGNPRVVYHGTGGDFDAFERRTGAASGNSGFFGDGFYFTTHKETADGYAGRDGRVVDAYLSISNPLRLSENENDFDAALAKSRKALLALDGWTQAERDAINDDDITTISEALQGLGGPRVRAVLEEAGFDGVYVNGSVGSNNADEWVAFHPEQIKSATANRGTFDPDSASILESTAPDQTQTPAFQRWFGDSKVVDANGEPRVMYHATRGNFLEFSRQPGSDFGFHFGTPEQAEGRLSGTRYFSTEPGAYPFDSRGESIFPVYLSIQNPLRVTDAGFFSGENDVFVDELRDLGVPVRNDATHAEITEALERKGYDGLVYANEGEGGVGGDSYVALRPGQIKSATANRGTFDPDSASILESTVRMTPAAAEAAADVRRNDLSQTLPAGRGTIGWNYDDSAWTGTKGQLSNARARLQDKMIAWRDVQDQIASQVGQAIPDTANVYRLENLMHGRVATGIERIEDGQVEPLMKAMREAGVSQERLEEYLYARHAKERNADIARKNPAMPDGGSGMTNAEADKILRAPDVATLEPLAKRVDQIVRSTRRRMLDAGLITQEQFDAMEAQYTAYVPLRGKRVAETDFQPSEGGAGRGIDTRRNPIREALGRGAGNRADNILAEVIGDAQRSVILAEKARVGRAVLRLVLANPNPTLWQVEPVQTERTTDASGEVYERVVHDWSDPSIIAVKHRGQTYKVQINNVPLAQALSNVGIDQMGAVTRAAGAINRYFSAVLTQYNPAFLPVNATRDAIFGMTAMAAEHGERAALDAALHYPQAATAAFRHSIGKSGSGAWDRWATEFADAGGRTGYVSMPSVEDMSRKIGKGALSNYSPEGLKRAAFAVGDAISSMNDAVENALRLSAYVTLRKRGSSIEEAAAYAKDLTVNFNRKGYDGSRLNAWFLFYNAGIQGAKRASDVMRKPKTWGYLGALAAAQTVAAMYAMGLEDDDGENLWNKVPDHVKRRNLVIVLPDEGVVTVPMPYGFNVFTYMAGRVPAAMTDPDPKRSNRAATVASDMLSTATESFFPVPVGEGALGLLPTVLRIPVNIQTNRDDFGREIRRESMAKYDVPRASMGKPDTLEVFKLGAQAMNRVGGGDKYTPPDLSWFDVAPEDMEYLLGELGGGAGKFVIDTATVGQNLTGGDYSPGVKPKEIPIAGRFYQTIDQEASTAAQFYERRDAINRSLERVRDLYAEKGAEAAEAMLKAAPELKGAAFKRRKRDSDSGEAGSVIESNGRPQIIVAEPKSVFGLYKAAEEAIGERNEGVRQSYTSTPAQIIPTAETRIRDANVRTQNTMRAKAQRDFNTAWARDVTGSIE